MLPDWYNTYKHFIEKWITNYLDNYFEDNFLSIPLEKFKEAVYYSTSWGKKIRAIFALEFYLIFSGKKFEDLSEDDDILKFCIALEIIHAYSLVHDDLPAMDNDVLRRWEITTWKKYWEDMWILIWDLLNTLSFEILSEIWDEKKALKLIKLLSHSVWFYWMVWWQVEDLYYEKKFKELDIDWLISLHNKKTWELIKTSILGWIILAWKEDKISSFETFAKNVWLAFQIKDDILDVEWTSEETWKSVGWETKWFVYFYGIKKSKEVLDNLIKESLEIIQSVKNSKKIEFLVNYIQKRAK